MLRLDQSAATSKTESMGKLRQVQAQFVDDARGAQTFVTSLWGAFSQSRRKKALSKQLLVAYRDIGDKSADTSEAEDRQSFGSVKESETLLAERDAALTEQQGREERALNRLMERTTNRQAEMDRLKEIISRHRSLHTEADRVVRALQKESKDLRDRLARPGDPKPGEIPQAEIGTRLVAIDNSMPETREAEEKARTALTEAEGDLSGEKAEWAEEKAKLEAVVKEEKQGVLKAQAEREEARAAHDANLEALGKSVALAGFAAPEVKGSVDAAKGLLKEIQEAESEVSRLRAEAAVAKSSAMRFALITGGAILGLTLIIVLLVVIF